MNTSHHPPVLNGNPLQAWQADPTPITDVPAAQLGTFALEDDGRTHTISTSGVRWRRRDCLAPWMNGRTGTKVSVRRLPHDDDTIEVFDTDTGRHLGSAFLAAAASREQIRAVQAARRVHPHVQRRGTGNDSTRRTPRPHA
ncbi:MULTISPECIES: Mu transposase C-terminal domain-containing protein [Streptomyces]|uniref:Mu transposase C-terminal domain-containing protein n=2 Tax=Streptomyces TaxID=1883 RepID=A0ABU4JZL9_9ACTN|nr:Mu transposase C-terminal domain-containing protein [Streptomyces roseolus]MDX2290939.1 Mu transposase C-terminal domain-containing protein [Streptomyces roseolus]